MAMLDSPDADSSTTPAHRVVVARRRRPGSRGRTWSAGPGALALTAALFACDSSTPGSGGARAVVGAEVAEGAASDAERGGLGSPSAGEPAAASPDEPPAVEEADAAEPLIGRRPRAPDGYGLLVTPVPPPSEEELVLHALAGYEIVAIHSRPDPASEKLGFLRIGARLRAGAQVSTEGCAKGWYPLEGGGFACASKGLVVDERPPFVKYETPPPQLDRPFPYDWGYVRKWNSPMWWRVPSDDERARASVRREELEAARLAMATPGAVAGHEASRSPAIEPAAAPAEGGAPLPDVAPADPAAKGAPATAPEKTSEPAAPSAPAQPTPAAAEGEGVPAADASAPASALPLSPSHPWLEKGFFVSIGATVTEGGQSYWRTSRGAYVSKADVYGYEAKDFQGAELGDGVEFPFGFVFHADGTKVYELSEAGKLTVVGNAEHRDFFDLEEEVVHGGKTYMTTSEGQLLRKDHLRIPEPRALPEGLDEWERWIDVDLDTQLLVAYEGTRSVYVTLVSTGRKGTAEEPFETPTGRWRIYSKQVTSNMDGATASDGNYAIQDVPWVMYFEGSYALHGAFWHRSFGQVRSHGCVNLGPSDAKWLMGWTTPFLPPGWHGVHASDGNPGSTVIIRRSAN